MTFQIGDTVRVIGDAWYNAAGDRLKAGEYVIVADNPLSEYFIDDTTMTVEIMVTSRYPDDFEVVAKPEPSLLGILQMIETTSKRVGTGDTQAILFSLMEEVGELATEINIENGTKDREPSEDGVEGEAIDVLVVIGDLLTSLFGSLENPELRTKVAAKLAKWERNAR